MPNYIAKRHKYARGPITDDIKNKLIQMIHSAKDSDVVDMLADDFIEIMAVCRNNRDGFIAANKEIDRFIPDYQQ